MRLHTRVMIRDRRQAFLGSQSLRQLELDARREIGVILRDRSAIAALLRVFKEDWAASEPAKRDEETSDRLATKTAKKVAKVVRKNISASPVVKQVVKAVRQKADKKLTKEVEQTVKAAVKVAIGDSVKKATKEAVKTIANTALEPEVAGGQKR